MNWLKKIWHDPVGSKVIAVGVVTAIAVGITTAKGAWPSVWAAIKVAFLWLGETSAIYNWFWLLWALATIVMAGAIAIAYAQSRSEQTVSYEEYNGEIFFGVRWGWRYVNGDVAHLVSFCAKCDYQIYGTQGYEMGMEDALIYTCEDCGHKSEAIEGKRSEIENRVLRSIHKRLRNGTWRDVVEEKLAEQGEH